MIALAQKYNVKMPVLTAVARIIDNELTPKKAVFELMNLPQVSFNSLKAYKCYLNRISMIQFFTRNSTDKVSTATVIRLKKCEETGLA